MSKRQTALCDISFVVLAKLAQRVEVQAGLREVSSSAVFSFHFGSSSIEKLIKRKYQTLGLLVDNRARLRVYGLSLPEPVDDMLKTVIQSQIRTTTEAIDLVRGQVETAIKLTQYQQVALEIEAKLEVVSDDEIPF